MAEIRQINIDSPKEWDNALRGVPHSIIHTYGYCNAVHRSTRTNTFLFIFSDGEDRVVCPLSERVYAGAVDVYTPYGIGGFTGNGDCKNLQTNWSSFVERNGYIAGYIGLHPLFNNPVWFHSCEFIESKPIFIFDLKRRIEELRSDMRKKRRYQLKHWSSVSSCFIHDRRFLSEFLLDHYDGFHDRKSGSNSARITRESLEILCSLDDITLVGAGRDGYPEAVAMFGHTRYAADYLLNVSTDGGEKYSTFLIWWAVLNFKSLNIPWLNLGGGVKNGDTLEDYKRRFGTCQYMLCSIKQIYKPEIYDDLCRRAGVIPDVTTRYFPAYHDLHGAYSRI